MDPDEVYLGFVLGCDIFFITVGLANIVTLFFHIVDVSFWIGLVENIYFAAFYVFCGSVFSGFLLKTFGLIGFLFMLFIPIGMLFMLPTLSGCLSTVFNAWGWFSLGLIIPGLIIGAIE
ncbi:MAG: hypothetical protein QXR63_02695 [Candidatus Bathyarchaeia archaeon]